MANASKPTGRSNGAFAGPHTQTQLRSLGHAHNSLEEFVFDVIFAFGAADEAQDLRPCCPTCLEKEER